jgi:hemerythrin-like domain-containing protein
MATREQILDMLTGGRGYAEVGRELGLPAGQAYMIATGLAADGGDAFPPGELDRPGAATGSTQHLAYPAVSVENPTAKPHVHRWVKARAEADGPMRAAASVRDAAPGEPTESEDTDIGTVLTRDHDQVTALLKQLKTIPGVTKGGSEAQQSMRESIVDMVTVALSSHEAAEEEELWPTVRGVLADGDAVADTALGQEQAGKEVLNALGRMSGADEQFDELAEELDAKARKHVAFEDRVLLSLRDAMRPAERSGLGERILRAADRGPTRPHPHAPKRRRGAVKAAGAAGSAMDRARDKLGERPADRRGRAEGEPSTNDQTRE